MGSKPGQPAAAARGPDARRLAAPIARAPFVLRGDSSLSRVWVVAIGVLVIVAVTVADTVTDPQLRFYLFYWPAIAFVAWYAGRGWGWFAVALSSLGSAIANGADWVAQTPFTLAWNLAINVVSFAAVSYLMSAIRGLVDRERDLARTDFLTGLPNTRAFYESLAAELARSRRSRATLSLAYLDLDDFKEVNDRFGHDAGDSALREIAGTLRENLRDSDIVARLGGDEFAILLPETGRAAAEGLLGRLQERLLDLMVFRRWRITFSIGAVACPAGECTADEAIRRADDLMYKTKAEGKNGLRCAVIGAAAEPSGEPRGD